MRARHAKDRHRNGEHVAAHELQAAFARYGEQADCAKKCSGSRHGHEPSHAIGSEL